MTPHDVYLLDRLARAVQRGSAMTEAQRADLAEFVLDSASTNAIRFLAERMLDGRLRVEEILEVAKDVPFLDLVEFRRAMPVPGTPPEGVVGLGVVSPPAVSWWRKVLLWVIRRIG